MKKPPHDGAEKPSLLVMPSIRAVEDAIGMKAARWDGRCHEVSCKMLKARLVPGEERYGHYYGPVSEDHPSHGRPFQRHGWIETPNGLVVDPTRWVFECTRPYIFHGPGDDEYDAGGQAVIEGRTSPYPAHPNASADVSVNLTEAQREARRKIFQLEISGPPQAHLASLTGGQVKDFGGDQLFWLANLPLSLLGEHARAIYEAIVEAGQKAYIPIDNWRLAMDQPIAAYKPTAQVASVETCHTHARGS